MPSRASLQAFRLPPSYGCRRWPRARIDRLASVRASAADPVPAPPRNWPVVVDRGERRPVPGAVRTRLLCHGDRRVEVAFLHIHLHDRCPRAERRIKFPSRVKLFQRFVVAPRVVKSRPVGQDNQRQGIELSCPLALRQRFHRSRPRNARVRHTNGGSSHNPGSRHSAPELLSAVVESEPVCTTSASARRAPPGHRRGNRAHAASFAFDMKLRLLHPAIAADQGIRIRQSGIRARVVRILFDCLLVVVDRPGEGSPPSRLFHRKYCPFK